jgi:hypothetical protein
MRAPTAAPRLASSVVAFLNQPAATATATAASLVGIVLSLAPFIGSSTALALVGIPMLLWGTFQVTFKQRTRSVRAFGVALVTIMVVFLVFLAVKPIVKPDPVKFFYDGSVLVTSEPSPLSGLSFPPLTDDPAHGQEVDELVGPADLTVSCWVHGRFKGQDLEWASIVDGDYRTLWIPVASLGAMGRGAVRTLLPCSDWRWRISRIP